MTVSRINLSCQLLNLIARTYPGPFGVQPSTDGCDETFEVYCTRTGAVLLWIPYWEARRDAYEHALEIIRHLYDEQEGSWPF